jgi:hypothetical protein
MRNAKQCEPCTKAVTDQRDSCWIEVVLRDRFRCSDPRQECSNIFEAVGMRERTTRPKDASIINEDSVVSSAPDSLRGGKMAVAPKRSMASVCLGSGDRNGD